MSDKTFSRYNIRNNITSKYHYQGTKVYINKFDIMDPDILLSIENDLTYQRLSELHLSPIKGRFSASHLLRIHKYIFQDLYNFAGKIREEDISKGNTRFCSCQFILDNLNSLLSKLKNEQFLTGLTISEFTSKSAVYLSELNLVHPFREGNGRATREFYRCLALKSGYIIDWSLVDKDQLIDAFIYSVTKDTSRLKDCVYKVIENK